MNLLFFLTPKQEVVFLYEDGTVRKALEQMEKYRYSSVPVLTRDGRYVGTLTEGDLLWGVRKLSKTPDLDVESLPLRCIARRRDYKAVPAVGGSMQDLVDAAVDQNFVPIVDGRENFIGIVRRQAIMEYMKESLRAALENEKEA